MDSGVLIEGGGMRGFFSAGILEVLTEAGIQFPYAIGISSGTLNLLAHAQRKPLSDLSFFSSTSEGFLRVRHLLAPERGLLDTDRFFRGIGDIYPSLSELSSSWQIAAVHAATAEMHYRGLNGFRDAAQFEEFVQASASIPVLMPRAEVDGEVYVDGGIGESIPVRKMLDDGVRKPVLILTRKAGYRKRRQHIGLYLGRWLRPYPQLREAMRTRHLRYNAALDLVAELERAGRVFVFRPEVHRIGRMQYHEGKAELTYQDGKRLAEARLAELQAFLTT